MFGGFFTLFIEITQSGRLYFNDYFLLSSSVLTLTLVFLLLLKPLDHWFILFRHYFRILIHFILNFLPTPAKIFLLRAVFATVFMFPGERVIEITEVISGHLKRVLFGIRTQLVRSFLLFPNPTVVSLVNNRISTTAF